MSLANGREYLAIPGPSVVPDRVLRAMHRAAPNIYAGELVEMTHGIVTDLRRVARTTHDVAMYIANGHGAWEAALCNTMSRGDKVLVLDTGQFGRGWGAVAASLGIETEMLSSDTRKPVDLTRLAEVLRADKGHRIKGVLAVHVETSSSGRSDIAGVRRALDDAGHPALLFSDNIASLAVDAFHMDDWGVDVMISASQKGLMVPPGMAFVYYSPRAAEAHGSADLVTPYWDWHPRARPEAFYQHFGGTAPTHHLYGLREALDMILNEEGLEAVWARHATLARAIWAAVEAWGQGSEVALNMTDRAARSHAVTTIRMGEGHGDRLRSWLETQAGVTLGKPLGVDLPEASGVFRIGHMGHVNAHMVMGVLGAMQAGMLALDVPHGSGALEAAARVMAGVGQDSTAAPVPYPASISSASAVS